jgi:hypothetical protein
MNKTNLFHDENKDITPITNEEWDIIYKAKETLKDNYIPKNFYSLGKYAENCVCLEKKNKGWRVYMGQKGASQDVIKYDNENYAIYELFYRLSVKPDNLIEEFNEKCKELAPKEIKTLTKTK